MGNSLVTVLDTGRLCPSVLGQQLQGFLTPNPRLSTGHLAPTVHNQLLPKDSLTCYHPRKTGHLGHGQHVLEMVSRPGQSKESKEKVGGTWREAPRFHRAEPPNPSWELPEEPLTAPRGDCRNRESVSRPCPYPLHGFSHQSSAAHSTRSSESRPLL